MVEERLWAVGSGVCV